MLSLKADFRQLVNSCSFCVICVWMMLWLHGRKLEAVTIGLLNASFVVFCNFLSALKKELRVTGLIDDNMR